MDNSLNLVAVYDRFMHLLFFCTAEQAAALLHHPGVHLLPEGGVVLFTKPCARIEKNIKAQPSFLMGYASRSLCAHHASV